MKRVFVRVVFALYLVLLIYFVEFKMFSGVNRSNLPLAERMNLEPLRYIKIYLRYFHRPYYALNIWGNIIPFIPLGTLLPASFKPMRRVFTAVPACLAFILAMETIQLYSGRGAFDVDDILLNGLSAVLGYVIFAAFNKIISKSR